MLSVHKLTKIFGPTIAVYEVSFEIKHGEIFALIGPNGSGKTTIIKTIAGLLQPSSGAVTVGGYDVVKKPEAAKAAIGYVPDDPTVWSAMTGVEFLHFTGALYGVDEKTRDKRIQKLLSVFNLDATGGYFEDYSRGNKQKFTILAALLHEPQLLLIDEPIVGLDPKSAEIAKEQFASFAKQGGAVLLVTHTLSVAEDIADRIGVLKEGTLVATGSFHELLQRTQLPESATLEDVYMALTESKE